MGGLCYLVCGLVIVANTKCMEVTLEAVTSPVWLGEGPHWSSEEQALYFVSIFDRTIHRYSPATKQHTKATVEGMPTFILPVADKPHHFVIGLDRSVVELFWDGETNDVTMLREVARVDHENPDNRFNDAKADPRGRLFAGTMGHEYKPGEFKLKKGALYRIDPDGSVTKLEDKIDISNGLCWDVDDKAFYFIDSFEYAIRRYDYDIETGDISNPRIVFSLSEHGLTGIADGMTIDTDGNLWIANFDGSQVLKVDPRTGSVLQQIQTPALQTTSVTWGGANLDELYVTSAAMNRGTEQLPPCGATFKITGLGAKGYDNVSVKLN